MSASHKKSWQDPEHRTRQVNARLGKKHSEEHKRKISEGVRANPGSGRFKKGNVPHNNGISISEEQRRKISETLKRRYTEGSIVHPMQGKKHSEASKRKMSETTSAMVRGEANPFFGKSHSEGTKKKLRASRMQQPDPRIGCKHSEETKKRISNAVLEAYAIGRKPVQSGPDSSAWKGGSSFAPYPIGWTNKFKELIRERDGYRCVECGKQQDEEGKSLSVHHIDYDKANLDPKNLITLCHSCHSKTNLHDREYWTQYFRALIAERQTEV